MKKPLATATLLALSFILVSCASQESPSSADEPSLTQDSLGQPPSCRAPASEEKESDCKKKERRSKPSKSIKDNRYH